MFQLAHLPPLMGRHGFVQLFVCAILQPGQVKDISGTEHSAQCFD